MFFGILWRQLWYDECFGEGIVDRATEQVNSNNMGKCLVYPSTKILLQMGSACSVEEQYLGAAVGMGGDLLRPSHVVRQEQFSLIEPLGWLLGDQATLLRVLGSIHMHLFVKLRQHAGVETSGRLLDQE